MGSEAERKRMLMGVGGGREGVLIGPQRETLYRRERQTCCQGQGDRVYKQNECVFDHVRWQFNGELKIRRRRRQRERQKSNRFSASSHDPG